MKYRIEDYLGLECGNGWKIRDFEPANGTHLVLKIEMSSLTPGGVVLPPQFTKRSLKSLVNILGFVLRESRPYRRKIAKKSWVWDDKSDRWKPEYKVRDTNREYPPDVRAGDGILYGSYNVGRFQFRDPSVHGEVVLVREIDIEGHFPIEDLERVALSDFALERQHGVA